MQYEKEDLAEAKRQIDSTLHKLRETVKTLGAKEDPERYKSQITLGAKEDPERYKSQITLARRRIRAFELANSLIERELDGV